MPYSQAPQGRRDQPFVPAQLAGRVAADATDGVLQMPVIATKMPSLETHATTRALTTTQTMTLTAEVIRLTA